MPSPLEDLDELTLRCRDEKARLYIREAVASYRVGAFRASIVAYVSTSSRRSVNWHFPEITRQRSKFTILT